MGSLTSSPKAPPVRTVYVPAPAIQNVSTPSASVSPAQSGNTPTGQSDAGADSSGASADVTAAKSASDARKTNLLSRSRGRFGTVLTGFRGVLNSTAAPSDRKTLLGE